MDTGQRRPRTDWIHTANVQGNAIRDYTKWDDQPVGINSVPSSFGRAYSVMMTEPQGPVYTCYDTSLLEAPLPHAVAMPDATAERVPTQIGPDPEALAQAAAMLVTAKNPVLLADWAGRMPHGYDNLVKLAETVSASVIDIGARLNFPSHHKLNMSLCQEDALKNADLIMCLDARDWEKVTTTLNSMTRQVTSLVPETAKWIDISFADLEISSWSTDYQRPLISDLRILADTALAIPMLSKMCRKILSNDSAKQKRNATRVKRITKLHDTSRAGWAKKAKLNWNKQQMTTARLASEVWEVIKDEDWVTTSSNLNGWTNRLWNFDKPYRFPGNALGTSTQIGIALGVALAHRDKKRLVVDMQPDGDLMFDPGALWVAAKYDIPMLVVMYNNKSYHNDHEHQIRMAKKRGTPINRAHIGMDIENPDVDFAGLARSMGWYAEGPISDGNDVGDALRRAIKEVKAGRPALVDTVTQYR
jgi:acetolactate synthase-1/2/3 large subunit